MAISKVVYGNTTLIDISDTTATASAILSGAGAYGANGEWINGTLIQVHPSDSGPAMDGIAAPGSSLDYSRADHIHPSDTSKQDNITANGMLKGTGSAVTAATKGTDYGALAFTVTLLAANWSSNQQTISNANFLSSGYAYIVSPASASFAAYGEAQIYADDVSTDGQMVFHCTSAPSSNLTVNIVRVVSA